MFSFDNQRKILTLVCFADCQRDPKKYSRFETVALNIPEVASVVSSKDIYEKLDFVMTDETSHNLIVDEILSEAARN